MIVLRSEVEASYLAGHKGDDLAPGVLERIQVFCITPQLEEFVVCVENPFESECVNIRPDGRNTETYSVGGGTLQSERLKTSSGHLKEN